MAKREDVARYRANLQGEVNSAALYYTLAELEPKPQLAEVYRRLAEVEERHAQFWEQKLRLTGQLVPLPQPGWQSRVLGWLAKRFGSQFVLPVVATLEQLDRHGYDAQPESRTTTLPIEERSHALLLGTIAGTSPAGMEGGTLARLEGRHRAIGGRSLSRHRSWPRCRTKKRKNWR